MKKYVTLIIFLVLIYFFIDGVKAADTLNNYHQEIVKLNMDGSATITSMEIFYNSQENSTLSIPLDYQSNYPVIDPIENSLKVYDSLGNNFNYSKESPNQIDINWNFFPETQNYTNKGASLTLNPQSSYTRVVEYSTNIGIFSKTNFIINTDEVKLNFSETNIKKFELSYRLQGRNISNFNMILELPSCTFICTNFKTYFDLFKKSELVFAFPEPAKIYSEYESTSLQWYGLVESNGYLVIYYKVITDWEKIILFVISLGIIGWFGKLLVPKSKWLINKLKSRNLKTPKDNKANNDGVMSNIKS